MNVVPFLLKDETLTNALPRLLFIVYLLWGKLLGVPTVVFIVASMLVKVMLPKSDRVLIV